MSVWKSRLRPSPSTVYHMRSRRNSFTFFRWSIQLEHKLPVEFVSDMLIGWFTYIEAFGFGPNVAVVSGDAGLRDAARGQQLLVDVILPAHGECMWWMLFGSWSTKATEVLVRRWRPDGLSSARCVRRALTMRAPLVTATSNVTECAAPLTNCSAVPLLPVRKSRMRLRTPATANDAN